MFSMVILAKSKLPTNYGNFDLYTFESGVEQFPHLALVSAVNKSDKFTNVRIHSECMTGDVFSSVKCECGDQLDFAMDYVSKNGGIIIYLRQEGRGIGLVNKIKAYALQDKGFDTIEANHQLGFESDSREYSVAVEILKFLNVKQVKLLTNNPDKINALEEKGITVMERISIEVDPNEESKSYLKVKKNQMGHLLKKV
jgi:GTP cyclohydrolase II